MSKAARQTTAKAERAGVASGEAARKRTSDEACGPPSQHQGTWSAKTKAGTGELLEAALTRAVARSTSSSWTARCGPACRVVWQGCSPQGLPPMPIRPARMGEQGPAGERFTPARRVGRSHVPTPPVIL